MRANVYIDGFNLYYGIRRWPGSKWLDVAVLAARLFPHDEINRIRYFTAHVKGRANPGAPDRQNTYLRALRTLPGLEITTGRFLVTEVRMPLVTPIGNERFAQVIKTEEKGSDVNLATYLLLDAFNRDCEMAIVISNDSDLVEPIRIVQQEPFGVVVWAVNPHPKPTEMGAAHQLTLKRNLVLASQFPLEVRLANGKVVRCPDNWR